MFKKKTLPVVCLAIMILTACTPATATQEAQDETVEATATQVVLEETVQATATQVPQYETYHLKIASYSYITEAPYFLAQDNGYFAEQGLDVEFVRFNKSSDAIPALANGDLDVTTVFPSAAFFNAVARSAEIRIVSGKGYLDPNVCSFTGFVARTDLLSSGQLDDPNNWVGLKIATEKGAMAEYGLDILLKQNSLSLNDIEIVDLPAPNRLDALKNAAIDIAGAGEPWVLRIRNAGAGDMWKTFNNILPNTSWGLVAFGPSLLQQHPDVGRRFMIAFMKGLAKYNEGKTDSNVAILAEYTQLEPAEIQQMCWINMAPDGTINAQSLLEFQQWAFDQGYVTQQITAEQFWDPQFIEYAQPFVP